MCFIHFSYHHTGAQSFLSLASGSLFRLTPETFRYDPLNLQQPPCFLVRQDVPGSSCGYSALDLKSATFSKESWFLLVRMEFIDYNVGN